MTASGANTDLTAPGTAPEGGSRWFHGRTPDLLLGAGLGYLLLIPPTLIFDMARWGIYLAIVLETFVNAPHFGGTLLRAYERPSDRSYYAPYAIYGSLAIALGFAGGLWLPIVGSGLITVYLTWAPFHLAGQNYGIALLFLARAGVSAPRPAKRLLRAAFSISCALELLFLHKVSDARVLSEFSASYRILDVGLPEALTEVLFPTMLGLYGLTLLAAILAFARAGATARQFAPAILLVAVHTLWFALPAYFLYSGSRLDSFMFTATGRSIGHAIQYLWITSYFAQRQLPGDRTAVHLWKALLAGNALFALPILVAPVWIGVSSWSAGPFFLLFAVVSLHHFVLDGAVWKLRDERISKPLLGAGPAAPAEPKPEARWPRMVVGALGLAGVVSALVQIDAVRAMRARDPVHLEAATRRLAWFGKDRADVTGALAEERLVSGDFAGAEVSYREALSLDRAPELLNNLAYLLSEHGPPSAAPEGLALALEARRSPGGGQDPVVMDTLALAYAANGRCAEATRRGERALELARARGASEHAEEIQRHLARFATDCPRSGRPG